MLALATHGALQVGPPQLPAQEEDPPPRWLIRNVVRWLPLIDRWSPEFPELEPALILAVIAQESQGFPYAEAGDGWGSVGLMQVIPRSWTGTREQLLRPEFNTYVGMRMLSAVLSKTGGDLRIALASYNCGGKGDGKRLGFKHCAPGGGLTMRTASWATGFRSFVERLVSWIKCLILPGPRCRTGSDDEDAT